MMTHNGRPGEWELDCVIQGILEKTSGQLSGPKEDYSEKGFHSRSP